MKNCSKENIPYIELLISKGAEIDAKTNEFRDYSKHRGGKTPLHYASKNNSKEIVELLISKGAKIKAKDFDFIKLRKIFFIKII